MEPFFRRTCCIHDHSLPTWLIHRPEDPPVSGKNLAQPDLAKIDEKRVKGWPTLQGRSGFRRRPKEKVKGWGINHRGWENCRRPLPCLLLHPKQISLGNRLGTEWTGLVKNFNGWRHFEFGTFSSTLGYCESGNFCGTLIFALFAHLWASAKLKMRKSVYFVCRSM